MSGTTLGGRRAAESRGQGGPGLARMLAAARPGECPFCGDDFTQNTGVGRKRIYCQAPECKVAYFRCWRRDRRNPPAPVVHLVLPGAWRLARRAAQSAGQLRRWAS